MSQSLADLFGSSATETETTVTIDLNDFVDENEVVLLADISNSSPAQKAAAWLAWLHRTQAPQVDENGNTIVDKTQAIVPQVAFTTKTFEVRDDESQIKNELDFAVYTRDNVGFDPDDAV